MIYITYEHVWDLKIIAIKLSQAFGPNMPPDVESSPFNQFDQTRDIFY